MKKKEEEGLKNVSFWIINSKNKSQRWGNWNGKSARTYQLLCLLQHQGDKQQQLPPLKKTVSRVDGRTKGSK